MTRRTERLNSLIKETIAEVIAREIKNHTITQLLTVTKVDISPDLHQAKVYISVIGTEEEKNRTIKDLNHAKGAIAVMASKHVRIHYFPNLTFLLDTSVEKQMKIEKILSEIHKQQKKRDEDE